MVAATVKDRYRNWLIFGVLMVVFVILLPKSIDDYEIWYNSGNEFRNAGRYKEAIASYDKALELKPDEKLYLKNRQLAVDKLNDQTKSSAELIGEIFDDDSNR